MIFLPIKINNWAGIKPKVLNQNKALAQKNNPKNKLTTNATQNRSKKDKELEEVYPKVTLDIVKQAFPDIVWGVHRGS